MIKKETHKYNPCKSVKSVVKTTIFMVAISLLVSCNQHSNSQTETLTCADFSIQNFSPISNWQKDSASLKTIFLDYENANGGFAVPSVKQLKDGLFSFEFEVKNNSTVSQNLYYKIYYQNESYKFQEYDSLTKAENTYHESPWQPDEGLG